jgi:hypothetical protein
MALPSKDIVPYRYRHNSAPNTKVLAARRGTTSGNIAGVGSSVAAWLSETVLRGRGPGASGFESHRRGRIFSKGGTSAGPWMCVYVFQGLTVGWWKEERHSSDTTARSAGFESQAGWASPWMFVFVFVLWRPEKGGRRREGGRG